MDRKTWLTVLVVIFATNAVVLWISNHQINSTREWASQIFSSKWTVADTSRKQKLTDGQWLANSQVIGYSDAQCRVDLDALVPPDLKPATPSAFTTSSGVVTTPLPSPWVLAEKDSWTTVDKVSLMCNILHNEHQREIDGRDQFGYTAQKAISDLKAAGTNPKKIDNTFELFYTVNNLPLPQNYYEPCPYGLVRSGLFCVDVKSQLGSVWR